MAYKVKKLVDENFNFDLLFPEKVNEVKSSSFLYFSIKDIVDFLQSNTNNFRDEFPLAKDLDTAIYRIYEKYEAQKEKPIEEIEEAEDVTQEDIRKTIAGLELIADTDEDIRKTIAGLRLILID